MNNIRYQTFIARQSGDEFIINLHHIVYVEESDQEEYITLRLMNGYTIDISMTMKEFKFIVGAEDE